MERCGEEEEVETLEEVECECFMVGERCTMRREVGATVRGWGVRGWGVRGWDVRGLGGKRVGYPHRR